MLLLVGLLISFTWKLVKPEDPAIRSQLVEREVPDFRLPAAVPANRVSLLRTWPEDDRGC